MMLESLLMIPTMSIDFLIIKYQIKKKNVFLTVERGKILPIGISLLSDLKMTSVR